MLPSIPKEPLFFQWSFIKFRPTTFIILFFSCCWLSPDFTQSWQSPEFIWSWSSPVIFDSVWMSFAVGFWEIHINLVVFCLLSWFKVLLVIVWASIKVISICREGIPILCNKLCMFSLSGNTSIIEYFLCFLSYEHLCMLHFDEEC